MKQRLDVAMAARGLASSRSQAESMIRLGQVTVNGRIVTKSGTIVGDADVILSKDSGQFVGRAALKLQSAAETFKLDFKNKVVLDVGSSTGGFTQYALLHGARKVIAVDVGTDQLHPSLRGDERIELHEKTDIRNVLSRHPEPMRERRPELVSGSRRNNNGMPKRTLNQVQGSADAPVGRHDGKQVLIDELPDMVVGDVSFISLRAVLPHVATLVDGRADIVAMVKPQFEAGQSKLKHKGVIKNDKMRREVLKDFEVWAMQHFKIIAKADSEVPGSKGNIERFYLLRKLS